MAVKHHQAPQVSALVTLSWQNCLARAASLRAGLRAQPPGRRFPTAKTIRMLRHVRVRQIDDQAAAGRGFFDPDLFVRQEARLIGLPTRYLPLLLRSRTQPAMQVP